MEYIEVNFDGLVGPTHNYAGLSFGNIASLKNANVISKPKAAALQGIEKMKLVHELGVPQAILPPHPRPNLNILRELGFIGNPKQLLENAHQYDSRLLATIYSASSMWTANAATISPGSNTLNNKTNIISANLHSNLHRAQEASINTKILQQIFCDKNYFNIHNPLPSIATFPDEGDANHSYLCLDYNKPGLELFVYGRTVFSTYSAPLKYPARYTKEAANSVARINNSIYENTIFIQQSPDAIDSGAFHNDVVCVGNKNVLLYHEQAFTLNDTKKLQQEIQAKFANNFYLIEIKAKDLDLTTAVKTYLFNSQIVSLPNNTMALIAPIEAKEISHIIDNIIKVDNPISQVQYVDCRQSMRNGGGPACLRLRVIMPAESLTTLKGNILFTKKLYQQLYQWINDNYRDSIDINTLLDEKFIYESLDTLRKLEDILQLKIIY